jgi:hypothetical protein
LVSRHRDTKAFAQRNKSWLTLKLFLLSGVSI